MKSGKLWLQLFSGFLALAVVVGLVLVFKGPPPRKEPAAGEGKPQGKLGGLFSSLKPDRPGIAVVKIYGPIQTEAEENFFGMVEGGADSVVRKIRGFRKNPLVKAIVIRVNSPGGTVAASQEILEEIKKARKDGKKVVVSMGDLAASGGYYVSCHADKIYADPGTITGSIGVFVGSINLTELAKKIGVDMTIIKSGKFKDILSPWRQMTDEERALLMETVTEVYEQFLKEVSEGRSIPMDRLRPVADGRILTGAQAKKLGLVDEMGGLQDAIAEAVKLSGLKGEPEIIRDYDTWWEDMVMALEPPAARRTDLVDILKGPAATVDHVPVTYLYTFGG